MQSIKKVGGQGAAAAQETGRLLLISEGIRI